MPFSSYLSKARRTGGGGAWASSPAAGQPSGSLLPSSSSPVAKSKQRKPRRRTAVANFLRTNIFTIALAVSILFFVLTLILYGIPSPISSRLNDRRHQFRRHKARLGSRQRRGNSSGLGFAAVDITTKGLYDKIEFSDVDGGAWKQGWRVTYKGNEWDDEKLKVFVVPHSHNDPGWKLTVEEYYDRQTRLILDTIVETLSKDSRRKFIWEEMSYLERWWRDASEIKKESFMNLVNNGQLEIVGGGWVMNDEANSHFYAIIEQMTEGNMWLNETFGFIPKNSWAIDPFGYSPTMAYLLRRMGFENMLIQRTHYELKKELALHKNLEYIWRQGWDTEESTDIFVHMMPFYSYDIPHTCGPEPAVCCQFDFARMRGFVYELCPWKEDPVETNQENVEERATKLLDQYRKKSTLYRTNTLLVPLGDDFRYISIDEAEAQFRNYQMLFDYINANPSLNAVVKFGTLEDYFRALREESERVNYSMPGELGSALVGGFPSLAGDFFTYADRQQDYWSGYYVSRPFFKAVDRVLEHTLRAAEILMSFLFANCQRPQCEKLPVGYSYKLTAARRNLALFQHHDGVTGTAKNHVVQDYGSRMHTSLQDLQIFMSKAIEVLLGIRHDKADQTPAQFEPEQVRSKYDAHPMRRVIASPEGMAHSVVFFNPLEQTSEEVVMMVVDNPDIMILDSNWTCIESQLSPELQHDKDNIFTGRHRVHWKVSIPAMGLQTYYIANGFVGCEKSKPSKLEYFSESRNFSCPAPYACTKLEDLDVVEIQNKHQTLTVDVKHGLLQKVTRPEGSLNIVGEEINIYSSSGGAYLFKPLGRAQSIIEAGGLLLVSKGSFMEEVFSYPKTRWNTSPISHSTRLYNVEESIQGLLIETEYHVELLGKAFNDKELIVRYKTDIDSKRIFYSDLNGFQMARRQYYDKIPLQGNYYPMPSLAFLRGSDGQRFSVHTRQSLGTSSLSDGWLEIMLDRRLLRDDGRGLGQGVLDNRAMTSTFHLLFETNVSSSSDPVLNPHPLSPSVLSHRVGAHLNYPLHAFIAKKPLETSVQPPSRTFAPLASHLPCDLHIVTLKVPRPLKYPQQALGFPRFVLILQRLHWDSSYCKKGQSGCSVMSDEPVNLFSMFRNLKVTNARITSLNLLHEDPEILGYDEQVQDVPEGPLRIPPMEVQAYKLELRPHQ